MGSVQINHRVFSAWPKNIIQLAVTNVHTHIHTHKPKQDIHTSQNKYSHQFCLRLQLILETFFVTKLVHTSTHILERNYLITPFRLVLRSVAIPYIDCAFFHFVMTHNENKVVTSCLGLANFLVESLGG